MKLKKIIIILLTVSFDLSLNLSHVRAETPETLGRKIVLESDRRNSGFHDQTVTIEMILTNSHGEKAKREMRSSIIEVEGDGDKSLTVFNTPADVKGTALLTFAHKTKKDDQWLYLTALKRTKRINSRDRSGSFMGSEFAYEDFAQQEPERYTYKWLRDEKYNGLNCYVVEYVPVDKKYSGYTRLIYWIDKMEYRVFKIEFYDRSGSAFKQLAVNKYKKYMDKYWRAGEMHMVNHKNGKSSTLRFSDFQFMTGLKEQDFSKMALTRAR